MKRKTLKKNPSNQKPISYSTEFRLNYFVRKLCPAMIIAFQDTFCYNGTAVKKITFFAASLTGQLLYKPDRNFYEPDCNFYETDRNFYAPDCNFYEPDRNLYEPGRNFYKADLNFYKQDRNLYTLDRNL